VTGRNFERKHVARVIEMDELFQALGVAVMKELFLEVRGVMDHNPFQEAARSFSLKCAPLCCSSGRPLLFRLRESDDALAGSGCGEIVDSALHAVARPIAPSRSHSIVISRLRLQTEHAYTENRLWMGPVEPDGRFRYLVQLLGIRTE
jgi:hypothetical protein